MVKKNTSVLNICAFKKNSEIAKAFHWIPSHTIFPHPNNTVLGSLQQEVFHLQSGKGEGKDCHLNVAVQLFQ